MYIGGLIDKASGKDGKDVEDEDNILKKVKHTIKQSIHK